METLLRFLWVFLAGGAICTLGQLLILKTNWTPSRILVSFVAVGVLLGAVGLFEPIKQAVGSGVTVPITGFGGALAKGAIEGVEKYGFVGILVGGLTAVSAGLAAAVTFALLVSLVFRSRSK